jgi:hypothetical protein
MAAVDIVAIQATAQIAVLSFNAAADRFPFIVSSRSALG